MLEKKKPRCFILENVENLLRCQQGSCHKAIMLRLSELADCGYNIYFDCMDAKDHGLPQSRNRLYYVGILKAFDQGFRFPDPIGLCGSALELLGPVDPHKAVLEELNYLDCGDTVFNNVMFASWHIKHVRKSNPHAEPCVHSMPRLLFGFHQLHFVPSSRMIAAHHATILRCTAACLLHLLSAAWAFTHTFNS